MAYEGDQTYNLDGYIVPTPYDLMAREIAAQFDTILGIDWGDVGRTAFGVVHEAGKAVLSAYGGQGLANTVENAEAGAGLLPDWARSGATAGVAV